MTNPQTEPPKPGEALLSFQLTPVQSFIAAARSTRDLHCSSHILSWLTLHALRCVRRAPNARILAPSLSDFPSEWLSNPDTLPNPCLPNTFLAQAPEATARELAEQCRSEVEQAWLRLADVVRSKLSENVSAEFKNWDKRWRCQVENYFSPQTSVLPLDDCTTERLQRLFGKDYAKQGWEASLELAAWLQHTGRRIPSSMPSNEKPTAGKIFPPKCSQLGSVEQMGPDLLKDSTEFWEFVFEKWRFKGERLRKGERLGAVSLVKRFCWQMYFENKTDLKSERVLDTATVAARDWLEAKGIDFKKQSWSGQWLHWTRRNQEEDEDQPSPELWKNICEARKKTPPPAYYAVLMGDGDNMGKWLRGEFTSGVDCLALREKISAALYDFAVNRVLDIVEERKGHLVYSGGDDVLALLPLTQALQCADELRQAFNVCMRKTLGDEARATMSIGLVAAHYKADLRQVLEEARRAEKNAKNRGRDTLMLHVMRRSGEHASSLCPWEFVKQMGKMVEAFVGLGTDAASDRFLYQLAAALPALTGDDGAEAMVTAEAARVFVRGEKASRRALAKALDMPETAKDGAQPGKKEEAEALTTFMGKYFEELRRRSRIDPDKAPPPGEAYAELVRLLQSASFLARGRDR